MPYRTGASIKVRVQLVDRNPRNDKIIASCNEEGLGMVDWGWSLY
jgi:DNA-directed RNA polymerase subunit E'/Rpb7